MKKITLTGKHGKGKFTLVDDSDFILLNKHKWHAMKSGYAQRSKRVKDKQYHYYLHRELMGSPKGLEIDHINGNKLDNRKENLRIVTRSQNNCNRFKTRGLSKFKGVYKRIEHNWNFSKPWTARLRYKGIVYLFKRFKTETEAAVAYNETAKKIYGKYARLNIIP